MKTSIASAVLMIRPVNFGFNEETAVSNAFQQRTGNDLFSPLQVQEMALLEFENFVHRLERCGIEVIVFDDTPEPHTPDSIFPNNWFSTGTDGLLLTYPMAAENRAAERRADIINLLQEKFAYKLHRELEDFEPKKQFLEGTGSLIIDQESKTAFAALSPRTSETVLEKYAEITGNKIVSFRAKGPEGEEIYHTNVMLCIADQYALIGKDTIVPEDRKRVISELSALGKELIFLTNEQVYSHFAGNMLQLQNKKGELFLIMSSKAKRSLTSEQLSKIASFHNRIIDVPLNFIELIGGGSARCMLAEIY